MSSVRFLVAFLLSSFLAGGSAFSALLPSQHQRVQAWGSSNSRRSALHLQRDTLSMSGPAILERESTTAIPSGPAVLDRPQAEERRVDDPTRERRSMGNEAWEVRIYNDGLNTREHVARSLVQVTGMTEMTAYQTMMQAHQNGIAIVGRFLYEIAEMYHDELRKNGIVCDLVPVDEET